MRILIPILGFGKSGGYRVLSQFANYWIKAGHEVTFLCNSNSIEPYFPTNADIIWFNDKGIMVSSPQSIKKSPMNVFIKQYALYKALNLYGIKYDIIMANHSLTALPISKAHVKGKKVYYIQAYEPDFYAYRRGVVGWFLKHYSNYSYKLNNLTKIVNSPIYFEYKDLKATKFVPCGLDLNTYYKKNNVSFSSKIRIGAIGRVEAFKGTTYALSAFLKLLDLKTDYQFELNLAFGDKSLETENIKCPQPNGDSELADFYREMDIIIAPGTTQYGAIHYPVIEAMACGTPVITTYYMPATDNNAWLVEPHSVDSIVSMVLDIINNKSDTDKKILRANNDVQQFSWEHVAQKMINYF